MRGGHLAVICQNMGMGGEKRPNSFDTLLYERFWCQLCNEQGFFVCVGGSIPPVLILPLNGTILEILMTVLQGMTEQHVCCQ